MRGSRRSREGFEHWGGMIFYFFRAVHVHLILDGGCGMLCCYRALVGFRVLSGSCIRAAWVLARTCACTVEICIDLGFRIFGFG